MEKTYIEEFVSIWKYLRLVFDSIRRTEEWKSRMRWLLGFLFLILVLDCVIFAFFIGLFPSAFTEFINGIASEIRTGLIILSVGIFSLVFVFPYVLFRESAKIYEKQETDISVLKERYEGENPNIRIEEFNSEEKEESGIIIYNDNPNNDVVDIFVTLDTKIEHRINENYKEVGQTTRRFYEDNCHFEKWANGKNMVIAGDKNVLYFVGIKNDKEHLFLTKGFDLENHSVPFISNESKKVLFAKYDLYFYVVGKIDKDPRKSFKQLYRGELGFNRIIEFSPNGKIFSNKVTFTMKNIVQIVGSSKPLGVVLLNH